MVPLHLCSLCCILFSAVHYHTLHYMFLHLALVHLQLQLAVIRSHSSPLGAKGHSYALALMAHNTCQDTWGYLPHCGPHACLFAHTYHYLWFQLPRVGLGHHWVMSIANVHVGKLLCLFGSLWVGMRPLNAHYAWVGWNETLRWLCHEREWCSHTFRPFMCL